MQNAQNQQQPDPVDHLVASYDQQTKDRVQQSMHLQLNNVDMLKVLINQHNDLSWDDREQSTAHLVVMLGAVG